MIAEVSDWNWWYGPEHHSANDEDFDALYRRHLSNIYQALGGTPPEYLAQPLATFRAEAQFHPQTGYVHPKLDGKGTGYFDWLGAAHYVADHRNAAMHGKAFLLDSAYLGMDHENLYARVDFSGDPMLRGDDDELTGDFDVVVVVDEQKRNAELRLDVKIEGGKMSSWQRSGGTADASGIEVVVGRVLEMKVPFGVFGAQAGDEIRLRCSIWKNNLPLGALPAEGAIGIERVTEKELATAAKHEQWKV